jgi:hypothetical protein
MQFEKVIFKNVFMLLTKLQFDIYFQKNISLSAIWKNNFIHFQITIFFKTIYDLI